MSMIGPDGLHETCDLCDRQAVLVLSDSKYREPEKGTHRGREAYFLRMKRSGRPRAFCRYHMRPPRVLGTNGQVIQEVEING